MAQHQHEESNLIPGLMGMAAGMVWLILVAAVAYWLAI
jgi:hypothetical protein